MPLLGVATSGSTGTRRGTRGVGLSLVGADLRGLDLGGALFVESDLRNVRFEGANLYRAWPLSADIREARFDGADARKMQARGCRGTGAGFRAVDLQRADLSAGDLRGADFEGSTLGLLATGTDFSGANFSNCSLLHTSFDGSRLAGCRVDGAHGKVTGPIDVGPTAPRFIDGPELSTWFAEHGAPRVSVLDTGTTS